MAIHGQTEIPKDTMRETKIMLRYNHETPIGNLTIEKITSTLSSIIKLPDNYEKRCNLQFIQIKCKGESEGDNVISQRTKSLPIYVEHQCSMDLIGPTGIDHRGIPLTQIGMTGEIVEFKLKIISENLINHQSQINSNLTKTTQLEKEFKKRSLTDNSNTTTNSNSTQTIPTETTIQNIPNVTNNDTINIFNQSISKDIITKPIIVTTESINSPIVSEKPVTTRAFEEITSTNKLKESIKPTTNVKGSGEEKGLEIRFIYVICVIMSILILVIVISVINTCHHYKLIERHRFDYLNSITFRSYAPYEEVNLAETRL